MTELQPRLNIKFNVTQNLRIMSHLSSQWDITRENTIETEMSFLKMKKNFNQMNSIRLNANPSRVDRLIHDSFKEYHRVFCLISGFDELKNTIFYDNIIQVVTNWYNGIKVVQEKRRSELIKHQEKNNGKNGSDENDIISLANAIKDLSSMTRKARTDLWCAYNILNLNCNLNTGESLFDSETKVQDFLDKTFEIKTDLLSGVL
ncbi:hypothetical protein BpHYR1_001944 [Brachionus plicatilis]|uniref:Uncharacterized protein n=1 Tax=Brachionus plicatilis TaxID=10195 RepID=A0A3M7PSU5_BRAPC|nr:hypothetical protein BpHYR1_001944 [Brachionus plicatilis]